MILPLLTHVVHVHRDTLISGLSLDSLSWNTDLPTISKLNRDLENHSSDQPLFNCYVPGRTFVAPTKKSKAFLLYMHLLMLTGNEYKTNYQKMAHYYNGKPEMGKNNPPDMTKGKVLFN